MCSCFLRLVLTHTHTKKVLLISLAAARELRGMDMYVLIRFDSPWFKKNPHWHEISSGVRGNGKFLIFFRFRKSTLSLCNFEPAIGLDFF